MALQQGATDAFKTGLMNGGYNFTSGSFKMALYNGKYQEALALAKRLGDGMERQDAYRSGQYRQAVT